MFGGFFSVSYSRWNFVHKFGYVINCKINLSLSQDIIFGGFIYKPQNTNVAEGKWICI